MGYRYGAEHLIIRPDETFANGGDPFIKVFEPVGSSVVSIQWFGYAAADALTFKQRALTGTVTAWEFWVTGVPSYALNVDSTGVLEDPDNPAWRPYASLAFGTLPTNDTTGGSIIEVDGHAWQAVMMRLTYTGTLTGLCCALGTTGDQ